MTEDEKRHGMRTRAVHAGERPDPVTGASAPNLVMSTTFVVGEAGGSFSALSQDEDVRFIYTRWSNPTVRQLEEKLSDLEGGEESVCFSTGMAAVSALFAHLLKLGDHLVVSDVCYPGVAELVRQTLPKQGVEVRTVDTSDLDELRAAVRPGTRLVHVETPCNPLLRLTDIRAAADIAHAVMFFASDYADWVTGQTLRVSGGV